MEDRIGGLARGPGKLIIGGVPISLHALGLSLATYLGAALRFKALTFQSLWYDELLVTNAAARGLRAVLESCGRHDLNPPLFHISLWLWQKVFGISELSARALAATFGTLGIVALYFLVREIFSSRAGLFASLILAVNSFHLYYSQEVRPYALLFLLSVLSYLFFVRQVKKPGWKNTSWYVVCSVLLIYTHYFGLLVVASQAVFLCLTLPFPGWQSRARFLKFQLPSFLAVGLLYIPWIPRVFFLLPISTLWPPKPQPGFFQQYFDAYFSPETFVAFGLSVLLLLFFISRRREEEMEHSKAMLLCWAFVVLFLPYFRSFGHPAPLSPRYAMVVLPALLLAAGRGWEEIRENSVKLFLAVSLTVMSLVGIFFTNGNYFRIPTKQQYRQAVQYVIDQDPQNKFLVQADVLFDHYFKDILRRRARVEVDLNSRPERAEALVQDIRSGRRRGFWLLESSFANIMDSPLYLQFQGRLFQAASRDFLNTRASLFVGPGDFSATPRRSHLPLAWMDAAGKPVPETIAYLTLPPGTSAATPELGFSPGRYGLTISGQGQDWTRFHLRVEGDPVVHRFVQGRAAGEARADFQVPYASRRRLIFEHLREAAQVPPDPGLIVVRDIWLQKLVPLSQFLASVQGPAQERILVFAGGHEAKRRISPPQLEEFRKLGLSRMDWWTVGPAGIAYVAVLRDGRVIFENTSNADIVYQDGRLRIDARDDFCRVLVDGIDYVRSKDGLNIVLVEGSVVSSHFCRAYWDGQLLVEQ